MYIDEIKHFLRCVKNRKNTINNLDDGIKTMKIALAIKESGKKKKNIVMQWSQRKLSKNVEELK